MEVSFSESAWKRGWNDTKSAWTKWPFVITNVAVSIALFIIGLFYIAWFWGVGLAVLAVLSVLAYEIVSAPYKQRNEARKQVSALQNVNTQELKGKFFHDFDTEGYVQHQGIIGDYLNEDIIFIQYFDWLLGQPSTTKTVWVREIVDGGWALYSSNEEMMDAWEHGHVPRRR